LSPYTATVKKRRSRKLYTKYDAIVRWVVVACASMLLNAALLDVALWIYPLQSLSQLVVWNTLVSAIASICGMVGYRLWVLGRYRMLTAEEFGKCLSILTFESLVDTMLAVLSQFASIMLVGDLLPTTTMKLIAVIGTFILSTVLLKQWMGKKPVYECIMKPSRASIRRQHYTLSVVMVAQDNADYIQHTVHQMYESLTYMVDDFEVIVVNDGSADHTGVLLEAISIMTPRVRVVNYAKPRGYSTALATGLKLACKELTFITSSDDQFDIQDLAFFLPYMCEYDAVFGYPFGETGSRFERFCTWSWSTLVSRTFGLNVRDVDCEFKLFRTDFFTDYELTVTDSRLVYVDMLYQLAQSDRSYTEMGVLQTPTVLERKRDTSLLSLVKNASALRKYVKERKISSYGHHLHSNAAIRTS